LDPDAFCHFSRETKFEIPIANTFSVRFASPSIIQTKKRRKSEENYKFSTQTPKSWRAILAFLRIWKFRHRLAFSFAFGFLHIAIAVFCFLVFFCIFLFRWLQHSVACKRSCLL